MRYIMRITDSNLRIFFEMTPDFFEKACLRQNPCGFKLTVKEFTVDGEKKLLEYYEVKEEFQLNGGHGETCLRCIVGDRIFKPY